MPGARVVCGRARVCGASSGGFTPLPFWKGTEETDCPTRTRDVSDLRLFFPFSNLKSLFPKTDPVSSRLSQAMGQLQDAAVLGTGVLPSDKPAIPTWAPLLFLGPFWQLLALSSLCSLLELIRKQLAVVEMESDSSYLGVKFTLWSWMREQDFCVRGLILMFPFSKKYLLYAHLEMVRSIQNHPSTSQVVKALQKALWSGELHSLGGEEKAEFGPCVPLDQHPCWCCQEGTVLLLQASGEELTLAILSCTVSEQPSEDIDTNRGPFKSVMY